MLVDDDTELDGGSGYSDRLVTDLEWEALRHAQGRVDCSLALPKDMPPTLDDLLHLKDVPDEDEARSSLDQAGSILARAREDKLERIRKAELTERRKEARRNLMRAPSPLKDDLRKEIDNSRTTGRLDPQHQLTAAPLDAVYLDRQAAAKSRAKASRPWMT